MIRVVSYFGKLTRENRTEENCFYCVSRRTNSVNFKDEEDALNYIQKMKQHFPEADYEMVIV